MSARTTVKVATQTGAAKDDSFGSATGLTEDNVSARLNVLANDPGAAKLYSLVQNPGAYASVAQFPVATTATLASGATITINADGTVGYDASGIQSSLQAYAAGESFTDSFVYTVRMANGALSTASVTVSVAGANDRPTLASVTPVSILDTSADDNPGLVSGNLAGADVDHGAILTYGFVDGVSFSVIDGKLVASNDYGTLTLDAASGAYSFAADADKIDALGAGQNAAASFGVMVTDEHGASADVVSLAFSLIGANDTAEIGGALTGSVSEDGTTTTGGVVTVSDRDAGEAGFLAPSQLTGSYGTFSFDAATGVWGYALDNGSAAVQALIGGQSVMDTLVVTSLDGQTSQTITVDIAGANEATNVDPVNLVTRYMVNHGQTDINNRVFINGFDNNDVLAYANNYTFTALNLLDTDGDGQADASSATFQFQNNGGKVSIVEVVLVGYTGLTAGQIGG